MQDLLLRVMKQQSNRLDYINFNGYNHVHCEEVLFFYCGSITVAGGAIRIVNYDAKLTIIDSSFQYCYSFRSGAIHMKTNTKMKIYQSSIQDCKSNFAASMCQFWSLNEAYFNDSLLYSGKKPEYSQNCVKITYTDLFLMRSVNASINNHNLFGVELIESLSDIKLVLFQDGEQSSMETICCYDNPVNFTNCIFDSMANSAMFFSIKNCTDIWFKYCQFMTIQIAYFDTVYNTNLHFFESYRNPPILENDEPKKTDGMIPTAIDMEEQSINISEYKYVGFIDYRRNNICMSIILNNETIKIRNKACVQIISSVFDGFMQTPINTEDDILHLFVNQTTFANCHTPKNGGAINFGIGSIVMYQVCCSNCIATDGSFLHSKKNTIDSSDYMDQVSCSLCFAERSCTLQYFSDLSSTHLSNMNFSYNTVLFTTGAMNVVSKFITYKFCEVCSCSSQEFCMTFGAENILMDMCNFIYNSETVENNRSVVDISRRNTEINGNLTNIYFIDNLGFDSCFRFSEVALHIIYFNNIYISSEEKPAGSFPVIPDLEPIQLSFNVSCAIYVNNKPDYLMPALIVLSVVLFIILVSSIYIACINHKKARSIAVRREFAQNLIAEFG